MNIADRPPIPLGAVSTPGIGAHGVASRRLGRPGLKLSDIEGMASGAKAAGLARGRPSALPTPRRPPPAGENGTPFANFSKIVCVPSSQSRTPLYSFPLSRDPSGALRFTDKAVLHAKGVNFSNGASFSINMSEFDLQDELGKGFYGTVRKVLHKPTKVLMAMKVTFRSPPLIPQPCLTSKQEIRLQLEQQQLNAILMELDVLHRAVSPEIIEFYGAFFIESCVYYCMEYMDAGSLDRLEGAGVPEDVLARIAGAMVRGLKFLKDKLQVIHRGAS